MSQANDQSGVGAAQTRVSDLQGSVKNLQSSLDAVDPSVTGRTTGTFTTDAQRSALVGKESAPIQTKLATTNNDLGTAQGNFNTAQGNANTLASAILGQNQQTYQQLLDQYNGAAAEEKQQEAVREFNAQLQEQQSQDAEKVREANLAASSSAGTSAGSSAGGGGGTPAVPAADPTKAPNLTGGKTQQDAYNAVKSLLLTNNKNLINATATAIEKSAGYGNTYDAYKLQLLNTIAPQFYKGQIYYGGSLGNGATF